MYRDKMDLPKRCRLMVLSGFTMLLYGTAFFQREIPVNEVVLVSSDYVQAKANAISFTNQVYEKKYYNKMNQLCLSLLYRYPTINEGASKPLQAINEEITAQRDKWIVSQKELIEETKEQELLCNTNGNEVNYGVTYNEDDILSILYEGYLYTGGAHGMPYRMPQTFRLSTGKTVGLTELTGLTKDQVKEKVNKDFQTLYQKSPDAFWNNAEELVGKLKYEEYSYYVEKDGVHIYFDPYYVAPYAAGFVEIIL